MATYFVDFNLGFLPQRIFGAIPALLSVVDERDERCQRNIPVILAILDSQNL